MSKAETLMAEILKNKHPQTALERWLDAVNEEEQPCEHGHLGDSNEHRGACLDEVAHLAEAAGLVV